MNHETKSAVSKYVAGIALSLAISAVNAASVGLRPGSISAQPGDPITFALVVDFGTEAVLGGGIDITLDPLLSYDDSEPDRWFRFDPAFVHDPGFTEVRDAQSPSLVSVGFSNVIDGITGAHTVGELLLTLAPTATVDDDITLTLSPSGKWGGFVGYPSGLPIDFEVIYNPATVTAVPLPPTVWMFASGLAMMGLVRLRRQMSFFA